MAIEQNAIVFCKSNAAIFLVPISAVNSLSFRNFVYFLLTWVGLHQGVSSWCLQKSSLIIVKVWFCLFGVWLHHVVALHWNIFCAIFGNDMSSRIVISSQNVFSARRTAYEVCISQSIEIWELIDRVTQVIIDVHWVVGLVLITGFPDVPQVYMSVSSGDDLVEIIWNKSCLLNIETERNCFVSFLLQL